MTADPVLPDTTLLTESGDLASKMVAGLHDFLDQERASAGTGTPSESAKPSSEVVQAKRQQLARLIGVVDPRRPATGLELVTTTAEPSLVAATSNYEAHAVRWSVLDRVDGEGLLLRPKAAPVARVIALPDADWSPEQLAALAPGVPEEAQFARCLAESGCEVVVPVLVDRSTTWSGNPAIRMTGQPHREWIYRMAFDLGRHIIGYEVQKVLALVDLFSGAAKGEHVPGQQEHEVPVPVGIFGYGEGGLLALHAGALDPRIAAVAVSGYFGDRREVWQEPIYRNVWRLLQGFGDAELAGLVAPRPLVIEASLGPVVPGPPPPPPGSPSILTPGVLAAAPLTEVRAEVNRARRTYDSLEVSDHLVLVEPQDEQVGPGTEAALRAFFRGLDRSPPRDELPTLPVSVVRTIDPVSRLRHQIEQLVQFTQKLMYQAATCRQAFWSEADATSVDAWQRSCARYRKYFWDDVIGRCPPPSLPPNPRTRLAYDRPGWAGYEVMLDIYPEVFAYGILLVPKDIQPGERRPVVVCQHGLEGRAQDAVEQVEPHYRAFAAQLAERGYIVYAPQNPYIGHDGFRSVQRKANPLGWSLFSFIVLQHARTLEWLATLPFVDPDRIGLYGLSYGGKTAMRVPALLDGSDGQVGYSLSICSGDFNEWLVKIASIDLPMSYLFTREYEIFEFDLGHTFNYAEMAYLIAPRPFMVERGHRDGVGLDEWVAFEYAKVRRRFVDLRIPEHTEIAYFDGPHRIDGTATFEFLDRHLRWSPTAPRRGEMVADGSAVDSRPEVHSM